MKKVIDCLLLLLVFAPMAGAFPVFSLRRHSREARDRYIQLAPGAELALALALAALARAPYVTVYLPGVCGMGLAFTGGGLRTVLCVLTAFLWLMTALNCPEYFASAERGNRFYFFWLLTLGAMMGVFLAADLFTLFVFFEIMSFTSYVWVAQNETEEALRAGQTYLAIAVFGGMVLLVGLFLLYRSAGTLHLATLPAAVEALDAREAGLARLAGWCCLVGFGAKAGMRTSPPAPTGGTALAAAKRNTSQAKSCPGSTASTLGRAS